jgi:DNA polymerase-3 subunit delta
VIHLIKGKEQFLQRQTLDSIVRAGKKQSPGLNIIYKSASSYTAGDIVNLTTPSILGDLSLLVITEAEKATDALIDDVVKLCEKFSSGEKYDVNAVIQHSGAVRGKKMVDCLSKINDKKNVMVHTFDEVKKPAEKIAFIKVQANLYKKTVANDAANALLQFASDDLSILAGYVRQLSADVGDSSSIDLKTVRAFFKMSMSIDPWELISTAFAGRIAQAVVMFRHSMINGGSVHALIPLFNSRLHNIAKVSAISSGKVNAQDLGINPWVIKNTQQEARRFTTERLKQAFIALSQADFESKNSADAGVYHFEKFLRSLA